jgi:hypothetical protein
MGRQRRTLHQHRKANRKVDKLIDGILSELQSQREQQHDTDQLEDESYGNNSHATPLDGS